MNLQQLFVGQVLVDGVDVRDYDTEVLRNKIGFVPQQDLLRGSDTTYDTLENAAQIGEELGKFYVDFINENL